MIKGLLFITALTWLTFNFLIGIGMLFPEVAYQLMQYLVFAVQTFPTRNPLYITLNTVSSGFLMALLIAKVRIS